ncbi:hypothetical protein J6590_043439 [Homalodisca vitripennis]|nr:hypothetical protein J6590_043439 [Homalodisca vitripennis]
MRPKLNLVCYVVGAGAVAGVWPLCESTRTNEHVDSGVWYCIEESVSVSVCDAIF